MSRYEEYKDSCTAWMGEIPSHWKLERAKWHFTSRNERGNDTPVLLAATQKYGMYPQDMVEGVVKVAEGTDVQQFRTVHKGDFVISLRSFQGGFERSDYEGVCSPAYQVFYADDSWNNDYLKYLFKNELFIDAMNALTVGIREGRNIKYEDFANSILAIPPLAEQVAIAAYLDRESERIDAIIAEAKASIEEYKAWKASIIYEAVTKGLDPNVEMKDSGILGIGYIPSTWRVTNLKRVSTIRTGGTLPKEEKSPYYSTESGLPWIKAENLGYATPIHNTTEYYTEMALNEAKVFPANSVYVCCIGSIGKVGFSDIECSCNQQINAVTFSKDIFWKFGYYALMAQEEKHWYFANGNVLKILNATNQGSIEIAFPDYEIQKEIVSVLDEKCRVIDSIVDDKKHLIEDLESYKKSIIFEVVTGKRKVV